MKNQNEDLSPVVRPLPKNLPDKAGDFSAGGFSGTKMGAPSATGESAFHYYVDLVIRRRAVVGAVAAFVIGIVVPFMRAMGAI